MFDRAKSGFFNTAAVFLAALAISACDSGGSAKSESATAQKAAAPAPAAQDWTKTIRETEDGGYMMGNPDARVKLVEFGSLTCPHCRDFHADAQAHLEPDYIRTGKVSYEFRPFMLNIFDFAATELAMCQGPAKFFDWQDALYNEQDSWIEPFTKLTENDIAPLRSLPPGQQVRGLAIAGKLNLFAARRGLPGAEFDQCVSNDALMETLTKRQQASVGKYKINGTPAFLLNDKVVEGVTTWAQLKPKLDEAL